ncbi:MAG: LysR family transcriptional regulator [Deferribacterales bacterium]
MKSTPKFKPGEKEKTAADQSTDSNLYALKGRIWIDANNDTFFSFGRAVLLERIKEYGSISKAAKSMGMSYKHAWDLIDSMNKHSKYPIVEKTAGGKKGGGTRLTIYGEELLNIFWNIQNNFKKFLELQKELIDKINK